MIRGFASSTIDLHRKFIDVGDLPSTGNWWDDPPTPKPKETVSSTALRQFHKLRLKVQRSMSFGKSKDLDAERKGGDDIFFKPAKDDPYYEDMENFDPLDLSREGVERMKERLRKDTISRPMKLRKHPSKDLRALREQRSRERFRGAHPIPQRPALRNMSTTPDLRGRNKRDSGYINDLLPEFPSPPIQRPHPQAVSVLQELEEKRARLGSRSMADLSLASRKAAASRKPSNVLWVDRPVTKPVGIPPVPPLPPGAARPRLPSQPNISFTDYSANRRS